MDFHGYNDISKSHNLIAKCFWIFIVFSSTVTTISYSVVTIVRYVNNPSSVSVASVPLSSQILPDVQVCSQQIFNVTKLRKNGFSEYAIEYLFKYMSLYSYGQSLTEDARLMQEIGNETIQRSVGINESYSLDNLVLDYGLECKELLLMCSISGKRFNCCDYVKFLTSPSYGKCFILEKTSQIAPQTWGGPTGGLFILIDSNPESSGSINISLPGNTGIGVNIYAASYIKVAALGVSGVAVNKATYAALEETRYTRLTSNGCTRLPNRDCISLCYSLAMEKTINCTQLGFAALPNVPVCSPQRIASLFLSLSNKNFEYFADCSRQTCAYSACEEKIYKFSISYVDRDMERVRKVNGLNNYSSLSELSIFYSTLGYMEMAEFQTLTIDSVISSIGGNMGLFMGASIITVIQAAVLLARKLRMHLRRKKICKAAVEDSMPSCPNSLRRFSAPNVGSKIRNPDKAILYGEFHNRPIYQ